MNPSLLCAFALSALPDTPKKPVTDTYQGVAVVDSYRWLEDDKDPTVQAWSTAQNTHAREVLDGLPDRAVVGKRVDALVRSSSMSYFGLVDRHGTLFAEEEDPKRQQPFLVTLPDLEHPEQAHTLLDPNVLDPSGHTAIDFWVPSLDGQKLAVSLSQGGSEAGDLHVYDVATGKEIDAAVPHVNNGTAGGSVAWNHDGTGFWYTRYPRGTERGPEDAAFYQQVYFHTIGQPTAQDRYELGQGLPRIAEIALEASDDGQWVIAAVSNGDGGDVEFFLHGPSGWIQVSRFEDGLKKGALGLDDAVYFLSRQGAPKGKVLRMPLTNGQPQLFSAREIVPEGEGSITALVPTAQALYVIDLMGGPSRLRAFPLQGGAGAEVKLPAVSSVGEIDRLHAGDLALDVDTYLDPPTFYRLDRQQMTKTKLAMTSLADFSDCEVVRDFAVSRDGTHVPLNIIRKKGLKLNGKNPTLLYGYGGYAISEVPRFSAARRVWLDAGGVYVDVNLRGGGEFGDAWHKAGNLTHKQNVFDDFYAAARYLVRHKYCDAKHLGIMGGSNGGLLMGAELTQHPKAFGAVVSMVGIYDMLRVEDTPNGQFNVTEFGSVKDPAQFKALYAYSPYHRVKDHQAYPPVLFLSGQNDPRVDPWHSRKMVARLQAASAGSAPILLRTSTTSGHGVGSAIDEIIAQRADAYAFLLAELGAKFPDVK